MKNKTVSQINLIASKDCWCLVDGVVMYHKHHIATPEHLFTEFRLEYPAYSLGKSERVEGLEIIREYLYTQPQSLLTLEELYNFKLVDEFEYPDEFEYYHSIPEIELICWYIYSYAIGATDMRKALLITGAAGYGKSKNIKDTVELFFTIPPDRYKDTPTVLHASDNNTQFASEGALNARVLINDDSQCDRLVQTISKIKKIVGCDNAPLEIKHQSERRTNHPIGYIYTCNSIMKLPKEEIEPLMTRFDIILYIDRPTVPRCPNRDVLASLVMYYGKNWNYEESARSQEVKNVIRTSRMSVMTFVLNNGKVGLKNEYN